MSRKCNIIRTLEWKLDRVESLLRDAKPGMKRSNENYNASLRGERRSWLVLLEIVKEMSNEEVSEAWDRTIGVGV